MSTVGFHRRSDDPFAHSRRSSRSSTSPLGYSRSSVHALPAAQIHKKSSPSMHDINAEVSAIKPTNNKGRKRRWSPTSPYTDNVCQGNSFSSQDGTERESPPKAKRLARFKSQAVQSSPDIANQGTSANGHDLSVAEKQNTSVDLAGTFPSGDSLANHEESDPPSAIMRLCPDMCPGHAEVSAIKPTNKSGCKRRWSPPSPSPDNICQGNSFSSQDGTEWELPPKPKRLACFKSQAVQSSPDIVDQSIAANGHDLSVAEMQNSSVDLAGTEPVDDSLADHQGSDPPSAIIGLCPDVCPESERAEQKRNEDLDQYERLDGDRKQTSEYLAGQTSCSKHLVHSKESTSIAEDVAYYCQPTSLFVPTPSMQDRLPVTPSSHLAEIPSPLCVLIKEEEHTHNHQEVENCVVVSKQDEEVAEAKRKLILRKWRQRSSKPRQLLEEMELAVSTALNSLSLGPPIEQNELESNDCDMGEIKRDIVLGAPLVESCAPDKMRAHGCRELLMEDNDLNASNMKEKSKRVVEDMEKNTSDMEDKEKNTIVMGSPFPYEENSSDYDVWYSHRREEMRAEAIETERESEKKLNELIEESERVHANLVGRFLAFEQDIYIPDLQAYMERHNSCSNRSDGTSDASSIPRAINEYFAARSVPKGPPMVGESKAARALQDIAMSMRMEMTEAKWRGRGVGVDDDVLRSILKGPVGESKAARALQEIVTSARAEWRPKYYCNDISLNRFPFRKINGGRIE